MSRYIKKEIKLKTGRKRSSYEDQKIQLTIYLRRKDIELMGGKDKVRRSIYGNLNQTKP